MKNILAIAVLSDMIFTFVSCDNSKKEKEEMEQLKLDIEKLENRTNELENAKEDIQEDIMVLDSIINEL